MQRIKIAAALRAQHVRPGVINGKLDYTQQENCAEYYYTKFGYWTTVMSALTTWAIIAGLGSSK